MLGKIALYCTNELQPTVKVSSLKGSWDLVTRVINKVTILIITYNPNWGTYNLTY